MRPLRTAVHSTGHAKRLARETLRDYGNREKSGRRKSLLLKSAQPCFARNLMELTEREDHAAYVASG
jgi:antirestriction protein ArdC